MLYSVGKDKSSVPPHLARKAFYPGRVPFPLLHVNTGWKFAETIAFRDQTVKYDLDFIEHINPRGAAENVTPTHGLGPMSDIMKTKACARLDAGGSPRPLSAAPVATKRKAAPRNASIRSAHRSMAGPA